MYLYNEMGFKQYAEIKKIFVYNFFALCRENGMSDAFIIEKTGVSQNNLNKYRHHGKSIAEDKIFDMAKVLKLPVEKIFIAKKYETPAANS